MSQSSPFYDPEMCKRVTNTAKRFSVSFIYMEEYIDDVMEGDSIEDIEWQLLYQYEFNAFYDNHYMSELEIEEIL